MNAMLSENHEAPVLTLEAIEVHLSYLRPDLEAVKAALPVLRDKIEELSEKVDSKFEQANSDRAAGDAALSDKIDQLSARVDVKIDQLSARVDVKIEQLSEKVDAKFEQFSTKFDAKIDAANQDRAAGDAELGGKIDKLTERVLEMQGTQKGLTWFLGSIVIIASGASLAHTLGWI